MKVLLISANTERISMPVLPLGMAFVARSAEDAGHQVSQINLMAEQEALASLARRIQEIQPDIIGISVRNIDDQTSLQPRFLLEPVKQIVETCRQNTGAPIVLGGAGYSIYPEQALAYLGAEMGIQGEGEHAFAALLDALEHNGDISKIPGLYHAQRSIANPPDACIPLDDFRFPRPHRHLFTLEPGTDETVWVPFQTRRGCPLNCRYCSTATIEGKTTRARSAGLVIDALSEYVSAGFDHFYFVDNTFNLPRAYATDLCDRIIAARLNIAWRAIVYPWKVDRELVDKMSAAGCEEASLGMESGSDAMLESMNKQFRKADVRHAADLMKQNNIRRMGFLLLGGPGETRQTVMESLRFADSLALEMLRVTIGIRIYPHTALARHAIRTNAISPDEDLLFPKFYIEDGLEGWLRETVGEWMEGRPNWII